MDTEIRENCWATKDWAETTLRDPEFCGASGHPRHLQAHREKIKSFRRITSKAVEGFGYDQILDDLDRETGEGGDQLAEKGEFSSMDCVLPVMIGMNFRKRELALISKLQGKVDAALDDFCRTSQKEREDVFRFLERGEKE